MSSTEIFRRHRDLLQKHREDYAAATSAFHWPVLDRFNWALDWFDIIADEAAIVPSPDDVKGLVPKAYVILKPGVAPTRELALDIFKFLRHRLAPFKRVRRLEFSDLPKTVSGKIRRIELRKREQQHAPGGVRRPHEYWQEDFPELKETAPLPLR